MIIKSAFLSFQYVGHLSVNERWETYKLCRGVEVSKARYAKEAREEEK